MTSSAEHSLETALVQAWPPRQWRDAHVLLAVSGGPDSVALFRATLASKQRSGGAGRVFAAHFNHGLRGLTGDQDAAWLTELCARWQVPLEVGRTDVATLATAQGDGLEAAARAARYEFLRAAAERLGARFVAVAHQADDQAETVLHRILRGTGLAGLAGMPRIRPLSPSVSLVRPLLGVRRIQVLLYLQAVDQDYCTDSSNADLRWTRNRLRNELLPLLRQNFNAEVDDALCRLAEQAGESQQVISEMATDLADRAVEVVEQSPPIRLRIDCAALADRSPLLIREVCKLAWHQAGFPLQSMGFDQWRQLAELATGPPDMTPINLPGNVQATRAGDWLLLAALQSSSRPAE